MARFTNRNADYIQCCTDCRTFFTNEDEVDYSCSRCRKIYCRECLPNMIGKQCDYPPFGIARRYFCSELCLLAKRLQHKCISECRVFKVRRGEPEYPHASLMNN